MFDKLARLMGLHLQGAAALDHLAELGNFQGIRVSPPVLNDRNDDFSFSGLKTAFAIS